MLDLWKREILTFVAVKLQNDAFVILQTHNPPYPTSVYKKRYVIYDQHPNYNTFVEF